jgi:hypothetical protein
MSDHIIQNLGTQEKYLVDEAALRRELEDASVRIRLSLLSD